MIKAPIEMPNTCAECYFCSNPDEISIKGHPGWYERISKCLLAPDRIEDPWRTITWQLENKESWCPLKMIE